MIDPDVAAAGGSEAPSAPRGDTMADLVRELATVSDQIKAHEGTAKDLKSRRSQIVADLLELWERDDVRSAEVGGRKAFIHPRTFPVLRERPAEQGGGRYTNADVVAVLNRIGRGAAVSPPTVNHQTLGAILREYEESDTGMPPELAEVVELGSVSDIRVGPPRKNRP